MGNKPSGRLDAFTTWARNGAESRPSGSTRSCPLRRPPWAADFAHCPFARLAQRRNALRVIVLHVIHQCRHRVFGERSIGGGLEECGESGDVAVLAIQPAVPGLLRKDHRHAIVDRTHQVVGARGDDRAGGYPLPFRVLPRSPQASQRQRRSVGVMEEVRKLPARLALLPLVETVGRDQTPIAGKRVLECCARGCGFRPGVDMPGPDLGVLGEPGNQPQRNEPRRRSPSCSATAHTRSVGATFHDGLSVSSSDTIEFGSARHRTAHSAPGRSDRTSPRHSRGFGMDARQVSASDLMLQTKSLTSSFVTSRPTGTVTFLFTDIEGSTRMWEEHRTAMRDALEQHDGIVRGTIESGADTCSPLRAMLFRLPSAIHQPPSKPPLRSSEALSPRIGDRSVGSGCGWRSTPESPMSGTATTSAPPSTG